MLHKDYDCKGSAEKKNSGHEPQGVWCLDKLTGGKPPVVVTLSYSTDFFCTKENVSEQVLFSLLCRQKMNTGAVIVHISTHF
jgi:hypothetical protein